MNTAIEYTIPDFLLSRTTLASRLEAVEICIDNALIAMAGGITGSKLGIKEYQIDDSMVKIRTEYRNLKEITDGITALEKMRNRYMNQLNGRQFIAKDRITLR